MKNFWLENSLWLSVIEKKLFKIDIAIVYPDKGNRITFYKDH